MNVVYVLHVQYDCPALVDFGFQTGTTREKKNMYRTSRTQNTRVKFLLRVTFEYTVLIDAPSKFENFGLPVSSANYLSTCYNENIMAIFGIYNLHPVIME